MGHVGTGADGSVVCGSPRERWKQQLRGKLLSECVPELSQRRSLRAGAGWGWLSAAAQGAEQEPYAP